MGMTIWWCTVQPWLKRPHLMWRSKDDSTWLSETPIVDRGYQPDKMVPIPVFSDGITAFNLHCNQGYFKGRDVTAYLNIAKAHINAHFSWLRIRGIIILELAVIFQSFVSTSLSNGISNSNFWINNWLVRKKNWHSSIRKYERNRKFQFNNLTII